MTSHKQQLLKVSSKQTGDGIIQGVSDIGDEVVYLADTTLITADSTAITADYIN